MSNHPQIDPGWFKVKLAGDYAGGASKGTVRTWIKERGLRYIKVGGTVLIKRTWLDEWLEGFEVGQDRGTEVDKMVDEVMESLNA